MFEAYSEPTDGFGTKLDVRDEVTILDAAGNGAEVSLARLDVHGKITSGDVDVVDLFWGGTMTGSGATTVTGTLDVAGGTIDGRTLDNRGAGIWTGIDVRAKNGAIFNNYDVLDLQVNGDYYHINNEGATPIVNNFGTLVKTDVSPHRTGSNFFDIRFNNSGVVEILTGRIALFGEAYTQTAGQTLLAGGEISADSALQIQGGVFEGVGNVFADLNTIGPVPGSQPSLRPGQSNSIGSLTLFGDYEANSSELAIEIDDSGLDQVAVNGEVRPGGILSVSLLNGFSPEIGESFAIVENDGNDVVDGTFSGLPEGAIFSVRPK